MTARGLHVAKPSIITSACVHIGSIRHRVRAPSRSLSPRQPPSLLCSPETWWPGPSAITPGDRNTFFSSQQPLFIGIRFGTVAGRVDAKRPATSTTPPSKWAAAHLTPHHCAVDHRGSKPEIGEGNAGGGGGREDEEEGVDSQGGGGARLAVATGQTPKPAEGCSGSSTTPTLRITPIPPTKILLF